VGERRGKITEKVYEIVTDKGHGEEKVTSKNKDK
jgi:hypothetical protein